MSRNGNHWMRQARRFSLRRLLTDAVGRSGCRALILLLVLALSGNIFAGGGGKPVQQEKTSSHRHVVVVPYDEVKARN